MSSIDFYRLPPATAPGLGHPPTNIAPRLWRALQHWLVASRRDAPRRDVADLRACARRFERQDPRIATDLYAAADRHEQIEAAGSGTPPDRG